MSLKSRFVGSGARTLGQAFDSTDNNFDLIRLFAAVVVLVSHCFPLTGRMYEPFAAYLGGYDTGGGWGVSIFFVISGFLVTRSVLQRPVAVYARSRVLRIIPALALISFFEVFVIGPLFTAFSPAQYFTTAQTYFHLRNAAVFWLSTTLPGTFLANPHSAAVNGSIWTLPVECGFYILLPVIGGVGLLKPARLPILLAVVAGVVGYGVVQLGWDWDHQGGTALIGPLYSVLKEFVFFLSGALLWVHRDRIPFNGWLAAGCVVLLIAFGNRDYRVLVMNITLPYLVIYFALDKRFRVRLYDEIGDLSYGTYLFAFPVQQAIVAACHGVLKPSELLALALPVTLVLAVASWNLVERPALAIRHKGYARDVSVRAAP